jgi:hypothetical protein
MIRLVSQLVAVAIVGAVVMLTPLIDPSPRPSAHPVITAALVFWCESFIAFGIYSHLMAKHTKVLS